MLVNCRSSITIPGSLQPFLAVQVIAFTEELNTEKSVLDILAKGIKGSAVGH